MALLEQPQSSHPWIGPAYAQSEHDCGRAEESALVSLLGSHAFRDLFVEDLGWERTSGQRIVQVAGHNFALEVIAHKRGFQVFVCLADRYTLIDRYHLRAIQRQVAQIAHEHIIIYATESPRRQVWQWGLRLPDGKRFRHLEHPFFSDRPPPRLLAELNRLRFALDDEDTITLLDAVTRVREVLGAQPEYELFAKRPNYARRSDELARAMRCGGVKEFQDFILLHYGLPRFFAKKWHRSLRIELDEAEQLCAIGVIGAAKRYDVDRGIQFATYASVSAKRAARRLAADIRFSIRLPQYVLPVCFAAQRLKNEVLVSEGPNAARAAVEEMLASERKPLTHAWVAFERMREMESLSDRRDPAAKLARRIKDASHPPGARLISRDIHDLLRQHIERLVDREKQMLRLYHGFEGEPLTLQAIGERFGVTRERVRQILEQVHRRLRAKMDIDPEELRFLLPA